MLKKAILILLLLPLLILSDELKFDIYKKEH